MIFFTALGGIYLRETASLISQSTRRDAQNGVVKNCCIFFKKKLQKEKKCIFVTANWEVANWKLYHAEMVKTNKLTLQIAENEKCVYLSLFL